MDKTNTNIPNSTLVLSSKHKNYLEHEAKITPEIQSAAGMFTSDRDLSKDLIGFEQAGIMFPYYNFFGDMISMRLRLDTPCVDSDNKKIKYLQEKDVPLTCYFLKRSIPQILQPLIPLVIVEGEKKLLCVESNVKFEHPHAVLSYPGCHNFKRKNETVLAEPWSQIPLAGRPIFWVPDTDFFYNDMVYRAGELFVRLLVSAGAQVNLVDLRNPAENGHQKTGADDFIINAGEKGFLHRLNTPQWIFSTTSSSSANSLEAVSELCKLRVLTQPNDINQVLSQISKESGFPIDSIEKIWREVQGQWRAIRSIQKKTSSGPIEISIDGSIPRREIFQEISSVLKEDGRFYRYGDELLRIENERQVLIGPESLPGKLNDLDIEFVKENKKTGELTHVLLPANHAQAVIHSSRLRQSLDEIILFANHPIYDRNWHLAKPGYNKEEKIFYQGSEIQPVRTLQLIHEIIGDFLFRDEASRCNFVSLMLTSILRNKYRGARPMGALTGNKPQLGKTLAGRVISEIAEGLPPQTTSYNRNQEEFEKQIGAKTRTRDVLFIDNAKSNQPIESPVLERTITDDPISFRLLGRSETISRPNTLIPMISMNDAQFCLDLAKRALPISFFLSDDKDPSKKIYKHLSLEQFVKENRFHILQELCGMVETWKDAGQPHCNKDFRFRAWARDVGGILMVNGFDSFLDNLESAYSEYDKISHEIGRLFEECLDKDLSAVELAKICMRDNLFPEMFENSKKATTILSNLLTKYVGKRIPLPEGSSCVLKEGRWNPSLKVKTFVAVSGRVPGTAGTTGDNVGEGPRDLTDRFNNGKDHHPGTPGTETGLEKTSENNNLLEEDAHLRAMRGEGPVNVPGVPGENSNPLGIPGDLTRGPAPQFTASVPVELPTSPANGAYHSDNDLEWQ